MPRLLDLYVAREYGRTLLLCVTALLGIFYIATFIDLADKMFRGEATTSLVLRFFYFQTPQFVYYVIPIAVLVSTLVTIGVMTKNSELLVMRACGISLYRTSAPLVIFGLAASGMLYLLQERVPANREADRLNRIIRSMPPQTSALGRRWIVGTGGEMYHYDQFASTGSRFTRLWVYRVDAASWRLAAMDYASDASLSPTSESGWTARAGWTREFAPGADPAREKSVSYAAFEAKDLSIEAPDYFKTEAPAAEQMTYGQLREYVDRLRASGADVVPHLVALQRKVAFPFVAVIMTLLAIPFAVTTGRHGALQGIGIGIVLAIVYWTTFILFTAIGSGGLLPPMLAAWASNILFGATAAYMILTVRT
jgi:LPS export ABC transporter permease LptG